MLWHMPSVPGMDVSPLAWPAWMSWRAISGRVKSLFENPDPARVPPHPGWARVTRSLIEPGFSNRL